MKSYEYNFSGKKCVIFFLSCFFLGRYLLLQTIGTGLSYLLCEKNSASISYLFGSCLCVVPCPSISKYKYWMLKKIFASISYLFGSCLCGFFLIHQFLNITLNALEKLCKHILLIYSLSLCFYSYPSIPKYKH